MPVLEIFRSPPFWVSPQGHTSERAIVSCETQKDGELRNNLQCRHCKLFLMGEVGATNFEEVAEK